MLEIEVAKKFSLLLHTGERKEFLPGRTIVDDEVANHWYVKAHLTNAPVAQPQPGTAEYATQAMALAKEAKARATEYARLASEADKAARSAAAAVINAEAAARGQPFPGPVEHTITPPTSTPAPETAPEPEHKSTMSKPVIAAPEKEAAKGK